ncbi:hypothetical protein X777_01149 [Ooceraea biroi]|uniref:Retrovirus-related Pol polyprotein from transposon TNT 1-94-like beta-barrel domain-containing protein n=1 Tax=Ooceraea biroi TaxID=2015173 RepID=A0A026X3F7_OOCBI|nr:hypothetical protein X777_01149 [Ooceraea biroi]
MTANQDWLRNEQKMDSTVTTVGSKNLSAISRGTVTLNVRLGSKQNPTNVEEVLYVPDLAANLLSVSKIVKKGHTIVLNKGGCKVINSRGRIFARAKLQDGVYRLETANEYAVGVCS